MDNLVLIGMPGAGKSSIGVVLAKTLGMGFCDTDLILQQLTGRKLQDIINNDGLKSFLLQESKAICSLEFKNIVVATGGSAVLVSKTMQYLKSIGCVIYLKVSFKEIQSRIRNISTRGIALAEGQTLLDVYHERCPLYEKYADIIVDCDNKSVEKIIELIVDKLKSRQA